MQKRLKLLGSVFCLCLGLPTVARAGGLVYFDTDQVTAGLQGGSASWGSQVWYNGTTWNTWVNSALDTAVFSGSPGGTVNVSSSTTTVDGLQFDASGFTIGSTSGRVLTLAGNAKLAAADGVTAALTLQITTTSGTGLHKTGGGLIAIGSTNTINSNITIEGGTLSIAADSALGSTANDIAFSGGGKLRYTSSSDYTIPSGRAISIGTGGGGIETQTGNVSINGNGQLTGSGLFTKSGPKTLAIGSANAGFSGSVLLQSGTLVLRDVASVGGRPIAIAGGALTLVSNAPANFNSDLSVSADATINLDTTTPGAPSSGHSVGALTVSSAATLGITSTGFPWLAASTLQNDGVIKLTVTGLEVRGAVSGTGEVRMGSTGAPAESYRMGLIFSGGGARTAAFKMTAEDAVAGTIILANSASSVTYNGIWQGGGTAQESYAPIHDGGTLTLGADAQLNLVTPDLANLRTFHVQGNGISNTLDIASGFIADRTLGATVAAGIGALEVKDATLITHSTAGLPVVTKLDGQGIAHRAGLITFTGAQAKWQVATSPQSYDGGVRFDANSTLQVDQDLTHAGTPLQKWDGQWQVPSTGITLTKTGPAWLALGAQGYVAGTTLAINEGGVRFNQDPGAGWYEGNYVRGANGAVIAQPTSSRTLWLNIGNAALPATVEFAAFLNQTASLTLGATGLARIVDSPSFGEKAVVTSALNISPGGMLDLRNNRLVVDYDALAASPLNALESMVRRGRTGGAPGALWQGDGITSLTAAGASGTFAVGIAQATDVTPLTGIQSAAWGSATIDASSVLIRLTLAGDSDLDGAVNLNDLIRLANQYGLSTGQHWAGGDFDYDGAVTLNDLIILANNYGATLSGTPPAGADVFAADLASILPGVTVPEPGALWAISLMMSTLAFRRRPVGRAQKCV